VPNPRSAQLHSNTWPTSTMPARPICTAHAAHGFVGLALACAARDCTPERSPLPGARHGAVAGGATVAEVEQEGALEHPRWRAHPPGKWVEAAAHRSFLPTGRVERERKLRLKCTRRKRRQGGGCSGLHSPWRGSRRRRRPDSGGGALGQRRGRLRTWETAQSGRVRVRRGEGGVGSAAASSDTAGQKRPVRTAFNPPGRIWTSPPMAAN
jgi:hypothetical protein